MVHAPPGVVHRLSLPGRAGRALFARLLRQLHRVGGSVAPGSDRRFRRLDREHPDGGPRPELSRAAERLEGGLPGRPGRPRGAARVHRRLSHPAVAMGDRQLPVRVQAPGTGLAKPEHGGGEGPGHDPPPRVRSGAADARPARLLPDAAPRRRPPQHPLAAGRRAASRSLRRRLAVAGFHRRPDPARPQLVDWPSFSLLPGDRSGDVAQRHLRPFCGDATGRKVHPYTKASHRSAGTGVARPGIRARR